MTDLTAKQQEHLRKIAAAEDQAIEHLGPQRWAYYDGMPGREIARVLWPDSEGWKKVSRRHSTPAGGAMGATMPMKGARAARDLNALGMIYITYTAHHQALFRLSHAARRWLEGHPETPGEQKGNP